MTPKACAIFVRSDLTLMIQSGDDAMEIALTPRAALELAASLLNTGLEAAETNAAVRTGALDASEAAKGKPSKEPDETESPSTSN